MKKQNTSIETVNRRTLLRSSALAAGALGITGLTSLSANAAKLCGVTLEQPEGPFYPITDQFDKNSDLTIVNPNTQKTARGEIVILSGIIRDQNCKPVKGALVEIWQACDTGKYNHPGDPNSASLDPDFQYWGQMATNDKGEYTFKTIKPGAYPATSSWVRPPHIHMKVNLRGHSELTTQVYFGDEESLNLGDRILQNLPESEKDSVVINFKKPAGGAYRIGNFDATIRSI